MEKTVNELLAELRPLMEQELDRIRQELGDSVSDPDATARAVLAEAIVGHLTGRKS